MKKKNPSVETSDNEAYKFLTTDWSARLGERGKVFCKDLRLVFDREAITRAIKNTTLHIKSQKAWYSPSGNLWGLNKKQLPEYKVISHLEIDGHLEIDNHNTDDLPFNGIRVTMELYGHSPIVSHESQYKPLGCGSGIIYKYKSSHSMSLRIDGDAFFWKVLNDKLDHISNGRSQFHGLRFELNAGNVKEVSSNDRSAYFDITSCVIKNDYQAPK